jgi:hypothetical protein
MPRAADENAGGAMSLAADVVLVTRAQGTNLDIESWLRRIGLAQYAEMFRANDIDQDRKASLWVKKSGYQEIPHAEPGDAKCGPASGGSPFRSRDDE